ncbi:hypothetical protein ACJDT4_22735 [Clostridium neuense]|uniref:ABC transporter permease n=1 Tax=Clostridium neuense TaxID=1728934 RepID=A0ABW8TL05_9CLOT
MPNLIKYELKTVWRDLLVILAVIILLNLALLTRINVWQSELVFGSSCLIYFGGLVAVFISNIRIFTRDLKEDTGYLLFSVPQSGYSILGGKLVVVLLEFVSSSIIGIAFMYIFSEQLSFKLFNGFNGGSVLQMLGTLYGYISLIIVIYFIIAFTKMIMKGKRLSGLVEVIIFIAFGVISYYLEDIIEKILPQRMNISGGIVNLNISSSKISDAAYGNVSFNIANGVLGFIITVILFVATAYILEKKIDI